MNLIILRPASFAAAGTLLVGLLAATNASAACGSGEVRQTFAATRVSVPGKAFSLLSASAAGGAQGNGNSIPTIVGLWSGTLTLTGGGPYDQQFDQWFADGNELAIDNAVPPLLGNVCIGRWTKVGPQTYQLRHVTWNWDASGMNLAGTFLLLETIKLGSDGNSYSGTFLSDSFDTSGNVIPSLHAEGTVVATRITVE